MGKRYKNQGKGYSSYQAVKKNKYEFIPLIFIVAVLPLIVRAKVYDTRLETFPWFTENGYRMDFFLYYKSWFFVGVCTVMACILAYRLYIKRAKLEFSTIFIPLGLYALMAVLSSILSEYSYFSYHGIYEQFESIFVLIGYCLTAYYAFVYTDSEEGIHFFLKWWFIGIAVMCVLGILQFTGHDFYATKFGQNLIAPGNSIKFTLESNRVYMSLYNPNYVGIYVILAVPILAVLMLLGKNKKQIICYGALFIGLLLCIFGAQSKSGLLTMFVLAGFLLVLLRKKIWKSFAILIPLLLSIGIIFVIAQSTGDLSFVNKLLNMFKVEETQQTLTDMRTNAEDVEIDYKGNILRFSIISDGQNNVGIKFLDQYDDLIANHYDQNRNTYIIDDDRFSGFEALFLRVGEILAVKITLDKGEFIFTNQTEDGSYIMMNHLGRWDKIVNTESAVFTNNPMFASGRGYIWAKTIPLLKENWLLGNGADTFLLEFPQSDYISHRVNGYANQLVTKPHNMYLQMMVQTGVVSVIFLIIFYMCYFVTSLKLYFICNYDTFYEKIGVGIFLSTVGYMFNGLSNDTTITCTPIFWVLIGMGIRVNCIIRAEKKMNAANVPIHKKSDKKTSK